MLEINRAYCSIMFHNNVSVFYKKLTERTKLPKTVTLSTDALYSDSCD